MRTFLLIFYFVVLCMVVNAAPRKAVNPPSVKSAAIQLDNVKPVVRPFNEKAMANYRNDAAFKYGEEADRQLTAWERFWRWFWAVLARLFGGRKKGVTGNALKYLLITAAAAMLIYGLMKLAGVNLTKIFGKKGAADFVPYSESLENIHEINFDNDIEQALNQRNFKLTVRLLYLHNLKRLNDAGLISWQVEKTNSAYVNELADASQRQAFGVLTRQFEYVWYGNFPIDEPAFKYIDTLFRDFKQTVV